MRSPCARAAATLVLLLALPAAAQEVPALPTTPDPPAVACGRGQDSAACRALRARTGDAARPGPAARRFRPAPAADPDRADARQDGRAGPGAGISAEGAPQRPAVPGPAPRPDMDDVRASRIVPPQVRRFLADRRIDPLTRAYLTGIAGKERDGWTLADLQLLTAVVPALTELRIGTAVLSEFYEFLGLDPANLFEPQLGSGWQTGSTAFDQRNYGLRRRCVNLSRAAQVDPASVLLRDLLECQGSGDRGG